MELLQAKVDTHHKVLFSDRGELQFHTKEECQDRHKNDLQTICLKLEIIKKDMIMVRLQEVQPQMVTVPQF